MNMLSFVVKQTKLVIASAACCTSEIPAPVQLSNRIGHINDHLSDAADRSRERPKRPILLIFLFRLQKGIAFSLFFWYNRPKKTRQEDICL